MIDIDVEIECKKGDLPLLLKILSSEHPITPIYIVEFSEFYNVSFRVDYDDDQIVCDLRDRFDGFEFTDQLGIGNSDVRMKIRRVQANSTDGWGRPLYPFDKTLYLVAVADNKIDKINPQFQAIMFGEAKKYQVNIVRGVRKESNEKGFVVIGDPNLGKDAPVIINELFKDENQAFWAGIRKLTNSIQKEFEVLKQKRTNKRKRK